MLYHHRILSEALSHAVKMGAVARNVADLVAPPRPAKAKMATLTPEEVSRFLDATQGTSYYVFFSALLYIGLRRGELLALRWRNLDLNSKTLTVVETAYWSMALHIAYSNGPMDLRQTGKAYHVVDINQWYNPFGTANKTGHMVISGAGNSSGQAEYVSGVSGLPNKDRFKGSVTVDPDALTWEGSYTQYSYAYGTAEEVLSNYSTAVPCDPKDEPEPGEAGWWFIHYTEYIAH